ncbi:WD repeat-containing protein 47 [Trichonephila inaurata madagascariensis]|uniref:WD repeat-containing protein 47 n=1 Tax=Trichonephila inaurata madagascariensis TaxID=2747483 RepID=A0A8X6WU79_9ARAC|nr:WD repeat-containing protein 47 [Trichonephila inaurata madagascariensis]
MTTDAVCLKEANIIRLIQAYFDFRGLHLSLDALERESGIINCQYPEEALILRHLIVDGRWKDALHYLKRLPLKEEDLKFMTFEIMKQKYVELICVYEELGNELYEDLGNAIALCFSELSAFCPCPVEYENLRKLASLTKLSQDAQYKDWNPISSRRKCFQTICSVLLEMPGLGNEFREELMDSDRLTDLLVKGIIYESCEDFCETKVNTQSDAVDFHFGGLARNKDSGSSDLNLYSWLQSVPWVTMSNVFLNQTLTVRVDSLDQPKMKASWTEKILQNTTDLPEDVTRELRRPFSSCEDLKEHFWNKRIENNLIVDAPEILRRAEEVIGRWERRNSSTNINSTGDVRKNAQKGVGEGDNKRASGKLPSVKEKDTSMATIPTGIERKTSSETSSRYCEGNNKIRKSSPDEKFDFDVNSKITENSYTVENFMVPDSNDSLEENKIFDDKQNIRDLLKSKEKIRNKLLQILKNSTDDQNQNTNEEKSKESEENLDNSFPNKAEISSELKPPFYVQPQLLRKEENALQRIFKPKDVMDNSSVSLERR